MYLDESLSFDSKHPAENASLDDTVPNVSQSCFKFRQRLTQLDLQKDSAEMVSGQIEEQVTKLTAELRKIQANSEAEQKRNASLEGQINDLKEKMRSISGIGAQKSPEKDQASELNEKLKKLEEQLSAAETGHVKKLKLWEQEKCKFRLSSPWSFF